MPAYSFKEMFVPMVKDGSKPHTIRARRKNYGKIGDRAVLYFGMRTKHCYKLREEVIKDAKSICITKNNIYIYNRLLDAVELEAAAKNPFNKQLMPFTILSSSSRDLLAFRDGFRPKGTCEEDPYNAFELMKSFWEKTHALPWAGDIICWSGDLNY